MLMRVRPLARVVKRGSTAAQKVFCSSKTEQVKRPLSEEELRMVIMQKKSAGESEEGLVLEIDEIHGVAELVVSCLNTEAGLSATEMLVKRAQGNPDRRLSYSQVSRFAEVIRDNYRGVEVDESVLFDALWATYAPLHGGMEPDDLKAFSAIVWFGSIPAPVKEGLLTSTSPCTRAQFKEKLNSLNIPFPSCKASESMLRSRTNWGARLGQFLFIVIVLQLSKYNLIDRAMESNPDRFNR
eukprot:TRINITY_DN24662_c0_g1_i1.p1 TRINITY_DN24662_c0_g1~~TRINITY_DN24662_c0_g1_i1.p1  ORF type:complete len:240 (+),score=48.95 TRINITY_DN24662_c0_g1_i1:66-785(+)